MRIRPGSYFLIFLLLLGLSGIIGSLTFQNLQSTTLPLMMSSVIFVLAIVELIKDFRRQADTQAASEASAESRTSTSVEWQRFGVALGWMIGFAIVIYLAGFIIATPLFLVFYLKRQGRGWLMAALVAAVTTAVIYSIFEIGLKAPLYRGLIQNIF